MGSLLPLLCLAALASSQPHGYQYQLPKEYTSYSHQAGASYSQMEPFRRFLQKYMTSSKTKEDHPYRGYMSHPMGNVPVIDYGYESLPAQPQPYHQYMENKNSDWDQYMVGEYFFKEHDANHQHFRDDDNEDEEQLPYTVLEKYQTYEKRFYPSAKFVCNTTHVDTAADPLAGLERMNPYEVMMSKRYQKTPRSQQFMELFRYIQGVNKNQEEIEMTRPVVVFHNVTKETTLGNYEKQVMCFYLPQKYQEHEHHEDQQETEPAPRHAPASPPQPMDNGRVFLLTRPAMEVFVRRFGGFALTHDTWETQKDKLEEDILGQKYNPAEYFTASYDNPWKLTNKRNEVWIQSHQPFQTIQTIQTLPGEVERVQTRKAPVAKAGKIISKLNPKLRKAQKAN